MKLNSSLQYQHYSSNNRGKKKKPCIDGYARVHWIFYIFVVYAFLGDLKCT